MNIAAVLVWLSAGFSNPTDINPTLETAFTSATSVVVGGSESYTSKEGRFSVKFEGKPKVSNETVDTELGPIGMGIFMYEKSPSEVYMVTYSDYPPDQIEGATAELLLSGAKEGAIESLGINGVRTEEWSELSGNTSLDFTADNGTYFVRYKLVLVKNRLYQIAILAEGDYSDAKLSKKFFKSFKLI